MKPKLALVLLALAAVSGLAFVVQQTAGIYILTGSDEVQFKVRTSVEQTTAWLEFSDRGTTKFAVPASGILPVAYGGTGNATGTVTNTTGNAATSTLATNAINSTNFWGVFNATNLPAVYVAPEATHATNADNATYATASLNSTNCYGNADTATYATAALNSTNFYGTLDVTSLPAGLSTSNYVAAGWQLHTNAESAWPTAPAAAGAAAFVNSNGVVFVLTSGLGATWTGTNQIAPVP